MMYAQITEAKQFQQELAQVDEKQILLAQQIQQMRTQITDIEQQLVRLGDDQQRAQAFRCDLIQADCPYVAVIRKMSTGKLDEQAVYFQEQLHKLRDVLLPTLLQQAEEITKKKEQLVEQIQ